MPRAFLIARRRFHATGEFEENGRDFSPERGVRLADYSGTQQPTSDGASECGSDSSSECPDELYNLTKLAEVSLAAAAGTLVHPMSLYSRPQQLPPPLQPLESERTRIFFERIEAERESFIELKARRSEEIQSSKFTFEIKTECSIPESTAPISPLTTITRSSPTTVQQHHVQDGSEEHECPDCGKKYSTSSNLARHRQTHRSLGDKKARTCPHCDKIYVSIPAFSMHVRTHNQGCKCQYCGKCFSRPWLLQGHIRTHTGEKPFKCTICNKAFADKSNLRAHIQTHSNTKPHVCARCGKAFALKSYLYKHEESSCMRSQHHRLEKRETSRSPTSTNSQPTSVIVPPRNLQIVDPLRSQNSAFSAIIKHTSPERLEDLSVKKSVDGGHKDLLSRMVIRTSVISPNPEHLKFGENKKQIEMLEEVRKPFDFSDPTRVSAFSRPQSVSLNLALA